MLYLGDSSYLARESEDIEALIDKTPIRYAELYLDFETESRDPRLKSTNPHRHCWPLGYAFTLDGWGHSYYVPWGSAGALELLKKLLNGCDKWINHNIIYDAHVILNNSDIESLPTLVCTVALSHLIDADRFYKGGYGLEALSKAWLPEGYGKKTDLLDRYLQGTKDYGDVPTDILAEYACYDVVVNRLLYKHCVEHMPEESRGVMENEIQLTSVLLGMEREGLHIAAEAVAVESVLELHNMVHTQEKLEELLGYPINPSSSKQLGDLISVRYGQPIRLWNNENTDNPTPSYNKDAIIEYVEHPDTPEELIEPLELILSYKKSSQHRGLFYEPWLAMHENGRIRPSFIQNLRSGRMGCREPNVQQLDKTAKHLIVPPEGYVFASWDQSQVEYRVIAHYVNNLETIQAYKDNPNIDYHEYVGEDCGIDRQPAKTVNFSVAFQIGKKSLVALMRKNYAKQGTPLTDAEAGQLTDDILRKYHKRLPELKPTTAKAKRLAQSRGYIRNVAGRRLHLSGPKYNLQYDKKGCKIDNSRMAFNRAVQSTAADIVKLHSVGIQPLLAELGAKLVALVHDEYLFIIPDNDKKFSAMKHIQDYLTVSPLPLRVPLKVDGGWSSVSWAGCGAKQYDPLTGGEFPKNLLNTY